MRLRAMGDKALLPKGFWDRGDVGKSSHAKMKQEEVMVQADKRQAEEGMGSSLNGHGPGKGRDEEFAVLSDERDGASKGRDVHYRRPGEEEEEKDEVLAVNDDDQGNEEGFENEEQLEEDYDEAEGEYDEEQVEDWEEDYDEEAYDEDEDDKDEERTHLREQIAPNITGFAALNGQRQGFGNGQLGIQRHVNGTDKTGTSVEDAIEL